jgi:peptidoglycan/xylan/chitin deacetylase (PgdA/CDA1 family)
MAFRDRIIGAGFTVLGTTRLHRLASGFTRGRGAILMFHHVRPWRPAMPGYVPNRLLEITPEFLDTVIRVVRGNGFDLVSMDEALERLATASAKPFAALTFDDGYRDTVVHALPVLEHHNAPFTVFVATGFADRSAGMWWLELEEALRRADAVQSGEADLRRTLATRTAEEKTRAFLAIYNDLRAGPESRLLASIAALAAKWDVDGREIVGKICMDWAEIVALSRHPLAAIGAHSKTHKMLAKWPAEIAREEMRGSKRAIEERIGKPVGHFAYPVGDSTSAGAREFALAREAEFSAAVTTRPGMLFDAHRDLTLALPRMSINGNWQDARYVDMLLSGAPFALWNRGRRLNVD